MKLSDNEKRDATKLIQEGKPLPEKYRFLLFDDDREVELVWNGKIQEVYNLVLPFQTIEHIARLSRNSWIPGFPPCLPAGRFRGNDKIPSKKRFCKWAGFLYNAPMISLGVIGCGHWGPNHVRVFSQLTGSRVVWCADPDEKRLAFVHTLFPAVETATDHTRILKDPGVDAVVIAAPTDLHFKLTKEALEAGKHVLCEKPLSLDPGECLRLGDLARRQGKVLMVGHIFVFNRGIVKMREYIHSGELGALHYAHSERTNLGPFRYDVNALWDLAPHDIAIFNYLFDSCPLSVSARGHKCLGKALEDLAFATLDYPNDVMVNIHVSWLDPKKVRQITIVGAKKMVSWDDLDNDGPIKLYDKHVEKTSVYYETYGEFQLLSREGSVTIPKIGFDEPLKDQAQYFMDCVAENVPPVLADAQRAYDVVRTLCAIQESMDRKGELVKL